MTALNEPNDDGPDEAAIADAYRRGYEVFPQDEALGKAGLLLLSEAIRADQASAGRRERITRRCPRR